MIGVTVMLGVMLRRRRIDIHAADRVLDETCGGPGMVVAMVMAVMMMVMPVVVGALRRRRRRVGRAMAAAAAAALRPVIMLVVSVHVCAPSVPA